ncbi:hypothetical protein U4960_00625 [Altererythrobacter sp. H2]|uniref:hypothetical protein n=1 Tax=Altererythrobacter sp. H2 TaxID=3108391 RepID=UPI002B4BF1ED|nr:hypothetical protein [Altererythrobacter sp. H2]WRK95868.1 hypothetical protein U4960_00625 [Altererythrobacter sp. H2]
MSDPVWRATLTKDDLLEAIGFVRTRAGLRLHGIKLEPDVVIMRCAEGLSFRTAQMACDIPAEGSWPSPIRVNGAVLRRLAPKLVGPEVALLYQDGAITLNGTSVTAREI